MASPFIRESRRPARDNFAIPGSSHRPWTLLLAAWILASPVAHLPAASEPVDFNRDVLPLLSANCFECHGPDAGSREAELRLDDRDNAILYRDGHAVPVPGEPDRSELIARVTASDPLEHFAFAHWRRLFFIEDMPDRKDGGQPQNREAEQERDHAKGGEEPSSSAGKPDPEVAAGQDTEDDKRDSGNRKQPGPKRFPLKKDKPPVTIAPSGGSEPDVFI